ncbi:hypothetical protein ABPG75_006447 [Micractinium tetrahymenae]
MSLSLFSPSTGGAAFARLAVCAAPHMQRVLSAALSTSAASLQRAGAAQAQPKRSAVRFISVEAKALNDKLRTAWLAGWERHHAPTNPCVKPKAQRKEGFQHGHTESCAVMGLRQKRCSGSQ